MIELHGKALLSPIRCSAFKGNVNKTESAWVRRIFEQSALIRMTTFTRIGEDDTPSITVDASWRLSRIGKSPSGFPYGKAMKTAAHCLHRSKYLWGLYRVRTEFSSGINCVCCLMVAEVTSVT